MKQGEDFVLPSGAKLNITYAPFKDARALHQSLLLAVKGIPLSEKIFETDITSFKDAAIMVASSPEVERNVWECAKRATYNGIRVQPELFDDAAMGQQAREDFYQICWRVIEVNCKPFFFQIFSQLKERIKTRPGIPASTSGLTTNS